MDSFVTVQLLENTFAVLSLGKSCEENWCYCGWKAKHQILSNSDRRISCKSDYIVPIAVPGLSSEANGTGSADDSGEATKEVEPGEQDAKLAPRNRLRRNIWRRQWTQSRPLVEVTEPICSEPIKWKAQLTYTDAIQKVTCASQSTSARSQDTQCRR